MDMKLYRSLISKLSEHLDANYNILSNQFFDHECEYFSLNITMLLKIFQKDILSIIFAKFYDYKLCEMMKLINKKIWKIRNSFTEVNDGRYISHDDGTRVIQYYGNRKCKSCMKKISRIIKSFYLTPVGDFEQYNIEECCGFNIDMSTNLWVKNSFLHLKSEDFAVIEIW